MCLPGLGRHGTLALVLLVGSVMFSFETAAFLGVFLVVKQLSNNLDYSAKSMLMPCACLFWLVGDPDAFSALSTSLAVYHAYLWYQGRTPPYLTIRCGSEIVSDDPKFDKKPGAVAGVVWLHGLGDTATGCSAVARILSLSQQTVWSFPSAPVRQISVDWGMPRRAWFDVASSPVRLGRSEDVKGLAKAVCSAHAAIRELEERGLDSRRIWIGGLSQGGAVALAAALTYPKQLGGVACLGGWLPQCIPMTKESADKRPPLAVYWQHGAKDDCVLPEMHAAGVARLREAGADVVCALDEDAGHVPGPEALAGLEQWLQASMSKISTSRS
eukprot:TRINITY_DN91133_c0_g1_i1.p1 TRINITY_DN91133_c0_g1~~TRINITY_DN91133_c0_g1_i1.p1  ORF type:complete len:363 (+),score=13.85 TRINITY_DN91133_c0_g1_i1:106-1089(+)